MAVEIERKFLVSGDSWKRTIESSALYSQAYLCIEKDYVVRIRIAREQGLLAVKHELSATVRNEYEYEIPLPDAKALLCLCSLPPVIKTRHRVIHKGVVWEIDEYAGANQGLLIAEVELAREDQKISLPEWVGREVTGERRYLNMNLYKNPYRSWEE